MAAGMDMGDLPPIKCSSCGINVQISAMGDHICGKPEPETSQPPPPPPPKSSFRKPSIDSWSSKFGKSELPPRIDPLAANRPFLFPNSGSNGSLMPSPLTMSGSRSPFRSLQRSQTSPLPADPQSPDTLGDGDIPKFPLPRSMSERRVDGMALKEAISAPPVPAMRQEFDFAPRSALTLPDTEAQPHPLPKDDVISPVTNSHKYTTSIESKSSYRTSLASTRYGDRDSKRFTAMSGRRPSFGSVARSPFKIEEDIPPIPHTSFNFLQSNFPNSSAPDLSMKREGKGEIHHGLDSDDTHLSYKADFEKSNFSPLRVSSNTSSDRLSSSRGSAELFFRSPTQSGFGQPIDLPDLSEIRSVSPAGSAKVEYKAFNPSNSNFLQPTPPENNDNDSIYRKNSDATSESALSVSNFARALGLDISDEAVENLTSSSESSPSETRSGTSVSSLPSEASISRMKPADQDRLGPVVEERRTESQPKTVLGEPVRTASPTSLEPPPRIPEALFSPESPTDPALGKGTISLIPEKKKGSEDLQERPRMLRSATEPATRPAPRPRGPCRGCGEMIMGKSVSSADGRLTGRYHRACFVCYHCRAPFQTSDFYVLNDRPFCAQHYHERNGSLCQTCNTGIEGQYLETNERHGRGPADRRKFHPECLRCRTCQIDLKGEYFEWNGQVYCERDARRAAASMYPPQARRPGPPPSPLAPPGPRGRGYPPPGAYPGGRGRGFRPPGPGSFDPSQGGPPSARRFPERRTTKLMMI